MWVDLVRKWLIDEDRTQAWLSRRANINETYLSQLLSGKKEPGKRVLERIESVIGFEPGTLWHISCSNPDDKDPQGNV